MVALAACSGASEGDEDTVAAVTGTIENGDCGASSGTYALSVRYRDEQGETQTIRTEEPWSRSDDNPVDIQSKHFIGENVDLIRVSARRVNCVCTDEENSEPNTNPGDPQ